MSQSKEQPRGCRAARGRRFGFSLALAQGSVERGTLAHHPPDSPEALPKKLC